MLVTKSAMKITGNARTNVIFEIQNVIVIEKWMSSTAGLKKLSGLSFRRMSTITAGLTMLEDKDDKCCDLSMKIRVIAGAVCAGIGVILSICSFFSLATAELQTFAIVYSLGTITTMASSFFFAGPKRHIEALKEITAHVVSLLVIIGAIIMVFVSAMGIKGSGGTALAILFVFVQVIGLVFFTITLKKVTWAATKKFLKKLACC